MRNKISIEIQAEWKSRGEMIVTTRITDATGIHEYRRIESRCSYMFAYYRTLKHFLAKIEDADVFVFAPYSRFKTELKTLDPSAGSMTTIIAGILNKNNLVLKVR